MSALAGGAPTPGAPSTAPSASASGSEGDGPRKFSFLKPKKKASAVMPVLTPGDEGDGPAGNGGEESPRAAMRGGGVQEAKRSDDGRALSPRAGMRGGETTAVEQKVAASAGSSGGGGGGGGGGNRSGGGSGGGGGSFIRPIDEWLDTIGSTAENINIFSRAGISTERDLTDKLVPVLTHHNGDNGTKGETYNSASPSRFAGRKSGGGCRRVMWWAAPWRINAGYQGTTRSEWAEVAMQAGRWMRQRRQERQGGRRRSGQRWEP